MAHAKGRSVAARVRLVRVQVAAALVLALAAPLGAAANPFDGTWQALLVVNGIRCAVKLVMSTGRRCAESIQCGGYMTWQSGTYVFANGTLVRTVVDWEPKQRYVLDNGYTGHYEGNAKPPGGSFRVAFTSPNTMVWRDVQFGGTVTYRRAPR
ncbi:MAG TPA: hypothetical protein VKT83_06905 [bacterium]|nr:hypothetical protein [bacterium]